jgi:hypothetical protein
MDMHEEKQHFLLSQIINNKMVQTLFHAYDGLILKTIENAENRFYSSYSHKSSNMENRTIILRY